MKSVNDLPFCRFLLRISVHPRLSAVPSLVTRDPWLVTRLFSVGSVTSVAPAVKPVRPVRQSSRPSLRLSARPFSEDGGPGPPCRCRYVSESSVLQSRSFLFSWQEGPEGRKKVQPKETKKDENEDDDPSPFCSPPLFRLFSAMLVLVAAGGRAGPSVAQESCSGLPGSPRPRRPLRLIGGRS